MAMFRVVLSIVKTGIAAQKIYIFPKYTVMACSVSVRKISTMELTKNLTLLSHDKKKVKVVDLKMERPQNKPLVVMLSWMMANHKHIVKYADFYLKRGFDVVNISVSPWQLLWPVKGTQVVARDIVKFLDKNASYTPLLVHGFSVGGYVWSEALVQLAAEKERYGHILNRITGQVWDSLADITEIPVGLPFAVFPRNQVLQGALRQYIIYHMKTFDKVATCHYIRGSQMFHTNIVRAPALFFVSKTDPIGAEKSNIRCRENWENMGIKTYWKIWDDTPHVGHYKHYPDEYTSELSSFIESINFPGQSVREDQTETQLRAKL